MKLAEWRQEEGLTQQNVATILDRDLGTVSRWESGKRIPGSEDMSAIFVMTDGKVEPNDFYDIPAWRRMLNAALDKLGMAA